MNAADSKRHKERLVALRARLRDEVSRLTDAVLEKTSMQANGEMPVMPIHMADIDTDDFERELTLVESRDRTLERIEEALERIEDGVYGVCAKCEAKIPTARLNTIPYAILCVKCASQLELD